MESNKKKLMLEAIATEELLDSKLVDLEFYRNDTMLNAIYISKNHIVTRYVFSIRKERVYIVSEVSGIMDVNY